MFDVAGGADELVDFGFASIQATGTTVANVSAGGVSAYR